MLCIREDNLTPLKLSTFQLNEGHQHQLRIRSLWDQTVSHSNPCSTPVRDGHCRSHYSGICCMMVCYYRWNSAYGTSHFPLSLPLPYRHDLNSVDTCPIQGLFSLATIQATRAWEALEHQPHLTLHFSPGILLRYFLTLQINSLSLCLNNPVEVVRICSNTYQANSSCVITSLVLWPLFYEALMITRWNLMLMTVLLGFKGRKRVFSLFLHTLNTRNLKNFRWEGDRLF